MKKLLLCLSLMVGGTLAVTAQKIHVEKSAEFEVPDYTWNKLLQMKNGNTLSFHQVNKEGYEVTVYNKERKKIGTNLVKNDNFDDDTRVSGVFEINGEAVLFFYERCKEPILLRDRINASTGALVKEDDLGHILHLPAMAMQYKYQLGLYSGMSVVKDPESDYYATIIYDFDMPENKQLVTVTHYDGAHNKINEGQYELAKGMKDVKGVLYKTAVVDGGKSVFLFLLGYDKRPSQLDNTLIVARLNTGEKTFKQVILDGDLDIDFEDVTGYMGFNHQTNRVELMTKSVTEKKNKNLGNTQVRYYTSVIHYVDAATMELLARKQIVGEKVNAFAKANIDKDYEYTGLPFKMILNKDNTTAILMEAQGLGAAAISELSADGAELNGYAFNKKQLTDVMPFTSFNYIGTSKGHFMFYNEAEENMSKDANPMKPVVAKARERQGTLCVRLKGDTAEKTLLFDTPDADIMTSSLIEPADYSEDLETYATILVERKGRHTSSRIGWVSFE